MCLGAAASRMLLLCSWCMECGCCQHQLVVTLCVEEEGSSPGVT